MDKTIQSVFDTLFPTKNMPSYNRRFMRNHDPDMNDMCLTRGKGEFSAEAQVNFEKHLKKFGKKIA